MCEMKGWVAGRGSQAPAAKAELKQHRLLRGGEREGRLQRRSAHQLRVCRRFEKLRKPPGEGTSSVTRTVTSDRVTE